MRQNSKPPSKRKSQSSRARDSLGVAPTLHKFAFLIQFSSVSTAYTPRPFAKTESVDPRLENHVPIFSSSPQAQARFTTMFCVC